MKKSAIRGIAVFAAALLLLAAAGCAQNKLAEGFDEAAVISAGEKVVELLNGGNYGDVAAMVREDVSEALSVEVLADAVAPAIAEAGAFDKIVKTTTAGTKSDATGEDYAVAVVAAKYEKATRVFTVTFDMDMSIVGLYFK